jgi:hypothetical protein
LKAYLKDVLKPQITKNILDDLRGMRDKALTTKKSRMKCVTVHAVRMELFKARIEAVAAGVSKVMVHRIKEYSSLHVKAKLVITINAALRGYDSWLSQQPKTMITTLDANYSEACKQLQQFVALDTVQTRSDFSHITVSETPLLMTS